MVRQCITATFRSSKTDEDQNVNVEPYAIVDELSHLRIIASPHDA